ncbi:ABC transporter ATP-binding protein [Paracoccus sp. (in: a-proteobacteria)]|uniref:ABC transporter ATP-binding protein n=1 Tax=Paracoccus sp. TaxID=267 RepID=UPI003A867A22
MQHSASIQVQQSRPVETSEGIACRVSDAVKQYQMGQTTVNALNGLDLTIPGGEFIAIVGPSGSGKTTLLNMLGCIEMPDRGKVEVLGHDVSMLSDGELTRLRRENIGFIFQSFSLIPVLSAAENVEYPLILSHVPAAERHQRVAVVLEQVGLGDRARHVPGELSGGQRQRVAVARALIKNPRIVIADEPTAALDSKTGQDLMKMMRQIQSEMGTTFIVATHDPAVQAFADRRLTIVDGRIVKDAT